VVGSLAWQISQQTKGDEKTRLDQLIEWAGGDEFNGCLIFDEGACGWPPRSCTASCMPSLFMNGLSGHSRCPWRIACAVDVFMRRHVSLAAGHKAKKLEVSTETR
jgi:hypothetical protein